jgi:hypothetical protein
LGSSQFDIIPETFITARVTTNEGKPVPKHTTNAIREDLKGLMETIATVTTMTAMTNPQLIRDTAQKSADIMLQIVDLIDHLSGPKHGGNDG